MEAMIQDLSKSEINRIKPLWIELNKIHYQDSPYFKNFYSRFTFEQRVKSLVEIDEENIKISIVDLDNEVKGYCFSVIRGDIGEIESLYVSPELRGQHLGQELVELHKRWMKSKNCSKIQVSVSFGHDSVLDFYHKLGFYERKIGLEFIDESAEQ